MQPPPERYTFEREIKTLIPNDGDISDIARYLGINYSTVEKALNPADEDRHNPFYQCVRYLWALDCLRPGLGDSVLQIIRREREKWQAYQISISENGASLTANIGATFSAYVEAELSGKDADELLKQLSDVELAVQTKKQEILKQRNQKFATDAVARHQGHGKKLSFKASR